MNAPTPNLASPELYINRELSQLEFNRRVLEMAKDDDVPLLERLSFLCIANANLDEFFEIRVAGLIHQQAFGAAQRGPENLSPAEQLRAISQVAHELLDEQYRVLNELLLPRLDVEGIRFIPRDNWNQKQSQWLRHYFTHDLVPILEPRGARSGASVSEGAEQGPQLHGDARRQRCVRSRERQSRRAGAAIVAASGAIARVGCAGAVRLRVPVVDRARKRRRSVSRHEGDRVVISFESRATATCSSTKKKSTICCARSKANCRRAVSATKCGWKSRTTRRAEIIASLMAEFGLTENDIYLCRGPVNLNRLSALPDLVDRPDLKFPGFIPGFAGAVERDQRSVRGDPQRRSAAASSVSDVYAGGRFPAAGGGRSRRVVDPANAVSNRLRFHRSEVVGRCGQRRQRRARRHRTARALRRTGEHRTRQPVAGRGRTGGLRRGAPQDAREDEHGDPPRRPCVAPLRSSRHRQLSRENRARVYRLRTLHVRQGHRRRRAEGLPATHRDGSTRAPEETAAVTVHAASVGARPDCARSGAGVERPSRARDGEDECADRSTSDSGAVSRIASRREDRPDRPRHVCAASRRARHLRQHSGAFDRGPLPRTLARLLLRKRRRAEGVSVECRLDGAQFLQPCRNGVPDRRQTDDPTRDRRNVRPVQRRQLSGVGAAIGRSLQTSARGFGKTPQRAGFVAAVLAESAAPVLRSQGRWTSIGSR